MKRGFKSQCEKRTLNIREQLGLAPTDPLDASELAHHLNVTVWAANTIEGVSFEDLEQLTKADSDCWSAFTCRIGLKNLIVFNPSQSEARVNSVTMHELSHIILGHKLADVLTTEDGQIVPSHYDQEQEDEADWLAGTLLLPRPALLKVIRAGLAHAKICEKYMVSNQMLNWRLRMTGVKYQLNSRRSAM